MIKITCRLINFKAQLVQTSKAQSITKILDIGGVHIIHEWVLHTVKVSIYISGCTSFNRMVMHFQQ